MSISAASGRSRLEMMYPSISLNDFVNSAVDTFRLSLVQKLFYFFDYACMVAGVPSVLCRLHGPYIISECVDYMDPITSEYVLFGSTYSKKFRFLGVSYRTSWFYIRLFGSYNGSIKHRKVLSQEFWFSMAP
jgi:hypothetical protein